MWPLGFERLKYNLGTIDIVNDATSDTYSRGNYTARLARKGSPDSTWKTAAVLNFPRKQRNAYDLLYRVLREVVGERNS
jgi:hypothetical protein